jgi:hypothetical protein
LLFLHKIVNNNINLPSTRRLTKSHKSSTNTFGTRGEVLSILSLRSARKIFKTFYVKPLRGFGRCKKKLRTEHQAYVHTLHISNCSYFDESTSLCVSIQSNNKVQFSSWALVLTLYLNRDRTEIFMYKTGRFYCRNSQYAAYSSSLLQILTAFLYLITIQQSYTF